MSRPQVVVTVTQALPRRGSPTDTGTAFWAWTGASVTGPTTPVVCTSTDDANSAYTGTGAAQIIQWVGDALTEGANTIVLVRATGAAATLTQAEWKAALDLLTDDYGPGQVAIPGVTDLNASGALVDHANNNANRTVLIDSPSGANATTLATAAAALATAPAAARIGMPAPWVTVPAPASTTRTVPPSVVVCGLVARGDAAAGNANNSPAVDQGRGAGVIRHGIAVTAAFIAADLNTLHDAGVSVIRMRQGIPTLYGWRSVAVSTSIFRQLNIGRMTMQLSSGLTALMEQFLERQIDGGGLLYGEVDGALRGYMERFYPSALYGATVNDAYDVRVSSVNTPATAATGVLNAAITARLTQSAETINIGVSVTTATGSLA